jgi:hypothetical protein
MLRRRFVLLLNLVEARKVEELFAFSKVLAFLQRNGSFSDNEKNYLLQANIRKLFIRWT